VPHAAQPCSALRCGMMLVHPRRSSVSQVLSAKTHQENGLLVQTGSVRASVSVPHAAQPCSALRCGMMLVHPRRSSVSQVLSAKTHQENGLLVQTGSVRASVSVSHAAQSCSARRCGMALPHPRSPSVSQVLKAPPQRTCFCLSKRQSECQCAACGATVQRTALWHDACASTAFKCFSSSQRENSPRKWFACANRKRQSECQCAACGATVQRTALWHDACASTAFKRFSS
jgi:hypothetical protein